MRIRGFKAQKEPGVRLSVADIMMTAAAVFAWWSLASVRELEPIAPLPLHLIGTFLCFCNIFRIGTRAELAWAAAFVASWITLSVLNLPPYPAMLWMTVPVMVAVIAWSAIRGRYNGVGHADIARYRASLDAGAR